MSFVVGLTGGIGSGKSTVAECFEKLGVPIIDADIVAREVVMPNSWGLTQICDYFGRDILTTSGELNRAKLRQIVFADADKKAWLNNLLHPLIREEMLKQLSEQNADYVLWVVPLLIENKLFSYCDRILVIDIDPEIQLERVLARDNSNIETVKSIIQSQVARQTRLSYADDIIENNLPLAEGLAKIEQQVLELHRHYLHLAKEKKNE